MNIAFAADEFYLSADLPMPECSRYGDFVQLENGVGMWTLLKSEFEDAIKSVPEGFKLGKERHITMATGAAAYRLIEYIAKTVEKKVPDIKIDVIKIQNRLFGERITVAGLLCGADIAAGLEKTELHDELLIPAVALRQERDIFLDDMSVEELSEKLKIKVTPVESDGYELLNKILGEQEGIIWQNR